MICILKYLHYDLAYKNKCSYKNKSNLNLGVPSIDAIFSLPVFLQGYLYIYISLWCNGLIKAFLETLKSYQ